MEDESCITCHEPHSGDSKELLRVPEPELCLECHDEAPSDEDVVHPPFAEGACSSCHDPHGTEFSVNMSLPTYLVCMDCHAEILEQVGEQKVHSGDGIRSCENCHNGHFGSHANLLRSSVPDLCFGCHQSQADALELEYSHAVLEDCLDCHTPHHHRSDIAAKALCSECHDFDDEDFLVEHDPEDIDSCVDCHNPHGSDEEFMLE
jgi:predicted CXXCH cytochrome family protein